MFGARENNLKNIDVALRKGELTVITGPSGSGKSSLAFDILHREGQRRFLEGMSSYVRSILDIAGKPDMDRIEGLAPTIAIDQKSVHRSVRSTVGTLSEIYDYLRVLFAQFGTRTHGEEAGVLTARNFSFNHPQGACPVCGGLGEQLVIDPDLAVTSGRLTLEEGALGPLSRFFGRADSKRSFWSSVVRFAGKHDIDLTVALGEMSKRDRTLLFYSTEKDKKDFEGIFPFLERKYRETSSESTRTEMERVMRRERCAVCAGKRLNAESLSVVFHDLDIAEWSDRSVEEIARVCREILKKTNVKTARGAALGVLLREIIVRAETISRVGIGYLSLSRTTMTISGGEAQRIRLAVQLVSGLSGITYVLDEPSMGLHPRDTRSLIRALRDIRDAGNTVVVVEHDRDIIEAAARIVEIGPGAGEEGGELVFSGSIEEAKKRGTPTAKHLFVRQTFKRKARAGSGKSITVSGARENNLKDATVSIPLETLTAITGVSGSGKSTFVHTILARALRKKFYQAKDKPGAFGKMTGVGHIDKVITITQSAIGRSSRSNVATYTGIFSLVREIFAQTPEAVARKFSAAQFSFNLKGGRCEECQGEGVRKIEMHLLPDQFEPCEVCGGSRYGEATLAVKYKKKTIADVLDMSVREALVFFEDCEQLSHKLETLERVGLGYIRLGQGAPHLSGGEAQRVKMAKELARTSTGKTLYLLDEPTVGLHFDDVERLLSVLDDLVDRGNTVVMVEHNTDIIRRSDWMIDFGPEGGERGGEVVFAGIPEASRRCADSRTGVILRSSRSGK